MRLMISVVSGAEAREALRGGARLLDVKNPAEGSLGAQRPRIISEISQLRSAGVQLSAAIGDMPNLPGIAALAALGAAACGVDYVKVGLHGSPNEDSAIALLKAVRDAVLDHPVLVVAACYADYQRSGTLQPKLLPRLAASAGIAGCMVDTYVKDGRSLFDFLDYAELRSLIEEAHASSLLFGCAGALREQDLPQLAEIHADIVGLRTAVCRNSCRSEPLDPLRVRELTARFNVAAAAR